MRKNRMMRAASALMVAVLLTTSTISGTFAKYVTTSEAKDEARVAKWGVELQAVGNLYGETYGLPAENKIVKDDTLPTQFSVQSLNKVADVVAPGTQNDGNGFIFSLKGQPEVDGKITSEMTVQNIFLAKNTYGVMIPTWEVKEVAGVETKIPTITAANFDEFTEYDIYYSFDETTFTEATAWEDSWNTTAPDFYTLEDYVELAGNYYPVVYTLAGDTNVSGDHTEDTLKKVADAIGAKLGLALTGGYDLSANYGKYIYTCTPVSFEANTDLALDTSINLDNEVISWVWEFERATDKDMYNGADTILGMLFHKAVTDETTFQNDFDFATEGIVVKLNGSNFVKPVEYVDYCLETMFNLAITVEQVD